MDKIFETIKDFIYDSVDYLIMIVIIGLLALVIGWRVNILFVDQPSDDPIASTEQSLDNIDEDKDDSETINVDIPEGSLPSAIGDILEEHKLVSSSEEFIAKSRDMDMDTKLRSGSFNIEMGASLEDIIHIIAQ